ncbi:hypothetical protein [Cuniculiplasma divulgatum]|jgi:hypothetical protein|uniref:Uncharacterized protein n=1 Tax=Cuniculiplasma divulgatum TaxID=1673428 RepID=A0A1N5SKI5_9ARCH|nr:hypothetical protein [Cuniculiplasma divulgatum]EQB69234.1 MAG: hypothetical protein AMDU5_GPLC00004G0204 [Thermoplasmatales archaeon Gpl]MCI2413395.1 hypothetical protein [Cuniculiplasma sp.]MCL4319714.1 hypothetical protein [Candidatus Thermoplasmatota archaeon]OWP54983.1 MAG: hypothetical protein B2I18_07250 [Cuniculiplasma sp. C_DKE]WMT48453.1 MAG: hypothetical protein RE472_05085 [Thermoplasmatales archaeon]
MEIFKKERVLETTKSLDDIIKSFTNYLINNGWKVQSNVQQDKAILQAQKFGILRGLIAADRALTFVFTAESGGQVKVDVGVGRLLGDITITAIEVLLLSEIFIVIDIPEIAWSDHVEKELLNELQTIASQ